MGKFNFLLAFTSSLVASVISAPLLLQADGCGDPPRVANGYFLPGDYGVGATVRLACDAPYRPRSPRGDLYATCQATGEWTYSVLCVMPNGNLFGDIEVRTTTQRPITQPPRQAVVAPSDDDAPPPPRTAGINRNTAASQSRNVISQPDDNTDDFSNSNSNGSSGGGGGGSNNTIIIVLAVFLTIFIIFSIVLLGVYLNPVCQGACCPK